MESAELSQTVFDFVPLVAQWLGQNWLCLCLLGGAALALIFRDWLLKQEIGRFWPVGAALLPPLIPFARNWDQQAPAPLKGCIVPLLLLAVAVLQLYGQERNERYRKAADDAVEQQGIELRRIADSVEQQGTELSHLADSVEQQAALSDEQRAILYGLFGQFRGQSARMRDIANDVSRLADRNVKAGPLGGPACVAIRNKE